MRAMIPAIAAVLFAAPLAAKDSPDLEMWRLDCGKIDLSDAASFSDAHLYDGEPRTLAVSCYLIRDGNKYLLWIRGCHRRFWARVLAMARSPFRWNEQSSIIWRSWKSALPT
jgi:hypothetical protein